MRKLSLALMAVLCAAAFVRMPAQAQYIPAGSYQDSCDTIQTNGSTLSARCQDVSGNWHWTSTDINACPGRTFANNNGALVCGYGGYGIGNTLPRGSWRASCRNASENGGNLYAQCDNDAGNWVNASLSMSDCPSRVVDNSNGTLVCRGGAGYYNGGGDRDDNNGDRDDNHNWQNRGQWQNQSGANAGLPPGSWSQSCRNWSMSGNTLYAQCRNGGGGWTSTSYSLGFNHNVPLANVDGNLVPQNQVYRKLE